jgi:hypothetical protein
MVAMMAWTAANLASAAEVHPGLPTDVIAKPAPNILDVPWMVPWQVGPEGDGDPGSDGPEWNWGKIGALLGIAALLSTALTASGPLSGPGPQPASPPRRGHCHRRLARRCWHRIVRSLIPSWLK